MLIRPTGTSCARSSAIRSSAVIVAVHAAISSSSGVLALGAGFVRREVAREIGPVHRRAQPREHRVGVARDHDVAAVARRDTRSRARRRAGCRPLRVRDDPAELVVGDRRLHQRHHRFVDRDVDLLPLAAPAPFVERGQRADHREQRRRANRRSRPPYAPADGRARRSCAGSRPSPRRSNRSRARPRAARSARTRRRAPARRRDCRRRGSRSRGPNRASVPGLKFSSTTSHDAAMRRATSRPLRVAQVDRDRALVARDRRPPQAPAVDPHAVAPHDVAGSGRLDLDDVGAEIAEQLARERPRDERTEFEHAQAGQRGLTHGPQE